MKFIIDIFMILLGVLMVLINVGFIIASILYGWVILFGTIIPTAIIIWIMGYFSTNDE